MIGPVAPPSAIRPRKTAERPLAETWSCPVQEFQRESEVIAQAIQRMNAASQPAEA